MDENYEIINISSSEDENDNVMKMESKTINLSQKRKCKSTDHSVQEVNLFKKIKPELVTEKETDLNLTVQSSESTTVLKTLSNIMESNTCETDQVEPSLPQLLINDSMIQDDFKNFLNLCLEIDSSRGMKNFVDKLKYIYIDVDDNFLKSDSFKELIKKYSEKIRKKFAVYISLWEFAEELKIRRLKQTNSNSILSIEENSESKNSEKENITKNIEQGFSELDLRRLQKLETTMIDVKKKIEEFESEVVDWEKEEDSNYLKVDAYKKKYLELYNKYCEIRKEKKLVIKYLKLKNLGSNEMSNIKLIDEAIVKFINLKIKKFNEARINNKPDLTKKLSFIPDYPDVLQHITKTNQENNLNLPRLKMEDLALKIFKTVVSHLKRQREYENWYSYTSYFEDAPEDPAEISEDLTNKLNENKKETEKILNEVFETFAKKQDISPAEDSNAQKEDEDENESYSSFESDKESVASIAEESNDS